MSVQDQALPYKLQVYKINLQVVPTGNKDKYPVVPTGNKDKYPVVPTGSFTVDRIPEWQRAAPCATLCHSCL